MRSILCFVGFLMFSLSSLAQTNSKSEELSRARANTTAALNRDALTDTNQVFLFAFKVQVSKQASGSYKIMSLTVNDSVAYKLYRNFDFIRNIDYKVFAGDRDTATFVLPVAILLQYPTKINLGMASIDVLSGSLIKYLYLQDEKGNPAETSGFIYLPLDVLKTSTAVDH